VSDQGSRRVRRSLDAARERLARRRELLDNADPVVADLLATGQADKPAEPEEPAAADHPVPYAVRAAAEWSWRVLVIVAAVALLGWVAWQLRLVVFPIAVAALLTALLQPGVRWLRSKGWGRGIAAATVFAAFLIIVGGTLTLVGGAVSGQFGEVVERAGEGLAGLEEWFGGPPFYLSQEQIDVWVDRILEAFGQDEAGITEGAVSTAGAAIEFLTGMVLALVALVLFLYDGDRIWAWTVRLFPRKARVRADGAGRQAWLTLTSYIRGQTVVALFDAVFITVLLLILGVPLALPLGVLVFFGAYIPLVGAVVSGALAVLVALVANGLVIALIVLAGIIAVQQIEGNVFAPLVLGRMARIHPLAVIIGITVGVLTAGILGGIVAVPIVAIANSVGKYLRSAPH
jgi:predicted PurR-regulated permease PerM